MLSKLKNLTVLPFVGLAFAGLSPLLQEAETKKTPWYVWLLIILAFLAFAFVVFWWWLGSREEKKHQASAARQAEWAAPPLEATVKAAAVEAEPPKVEVPEVELPKVEVTAPSLDVELPKVDLPEVAVPQVEPPEFAVKAPVESIGPDDLKIIEGIGPKIAAILRNADITTFAQLAAMEPERIKEVLVAANPNLQRLVDTGSWPEQARLAAEGKWEMLQELQDKLKGGR